jgi:predicted nucleotidyltransferase
MTKPTIKVLDCIMGAGKSTYITNMMLTQRHKRFLYVTPMLSEARDLMPAKCSLIEMKTPSYARVGNLPRTKAQHLLELLQSGENISTTHALFKGLTPLHIQEIERQQYVLILDEVVDYITPYTTYNSDDIKDLFERSDLVADKDNLGRVSMNWDVSKNNHYKELHNVCDSGMLFASSKPENLLNIQIPTSMLDAAQEVIILTYMYSASTMAAFLKLHEYPIDYLIVPELIKRQEEVKKQLKSRIELIDIKACDKFLSSFRDTSLSYSWWNRAIEMNYAKDVVKYISNWLNNNKKFSNSFYYCCPKDLVESASSLSVLEKSNVRYFTNTDKYTDSKGKPLILDDALTQSINQQDSTTLDVSVFPPKFIPSGTKATNLFRKRNLCIVLSNIYANVNLQHYLSNYAQKVDEDKFAIAELVQFIFRGTIRNNDSSVLKVYLASPRMKKLFKEWLEKPD